MTPVGEANAETCEQLLFHFGATIIVRILQPPEVRDACKPNTFIARDQAGPRSIKRVSKGVREDNRFVCSSTSTGICQPTNSVFRCLELLCKRVLPECDHGNADQQSWNQQEFPPPFRE